ncbi:MAG: sugar phosphate isomerase/epimerase [Candidatus Latescibacterota bacterium]|jgi:sugar phosphate isomerase/epimerase
MDLGLDSFSYYMHWRYGGQTIDQLLDRVHGMGLAALQININGPRHRALTGTTVEHFRRVGDRAKELGIALEVASGGTDPSKLRLVLELARQLGAQVVRTTVNEPGSEEVIQRAAAALGQVAPEYEEVGIALAIENHEDLTAAQVVDLIERIDSPAVGAVYDSGNSLPFYRDPVEEARLLLPYIKTTHIKDHVLVRDGDVVWSVGTPLGLGRIPLAEIVDVLQKAPQLSRIMMQVCYGYAVRMPAPPIDVPPLALYEPIDRPTGSHVIWTPSTPSTEGKHGYLTPDAAHLAAAEGHVEAGVAYLRDLIGDDEE